MARTPGFETGIVLIARIIMKEVSYWHIALLLFL